jgi:sulfur carrier protein
VTVRITVNGQPREIERETALPTFLRERGIDPRLVAVAINGEVVPKDGYDAARVREGDELEVVRMVGGGR